jgi:hypothetical protein
MGRGITFSVREPRCDRVHHITEADVRIVLSRLPSEARDRLCAIHFNDTSRGGKRLGYVNRGRREIALCALPPRISFTRFLVRGQFPQQFGAKRGKQWPRMAIRRFMLYDVLLHELGHLQIIDEKAASVRRKFAMETRAQQFGMYWCNLLWAEIFDHPDPVHNPPTKDELSDPDPDLTDLRVQILRHPNDAELHQTLGKLLCDRGMKEEAKAAYEQSLTLNPNEPWTNLYLGNWYYVSGNQAQAIVLFTRAAEIMPERAVVWWCLGDAYIKDGSRDLAMAHYLKAIETEPSDKVARRRLELAQAGK